MNSLKGFDNLLGGFKKKFPSFRFGVNTEYNVRNLFANNEQGFWYDNNDLSTLFQDAAGTTPVTGPGQPVGLQLDKSKGLVLGSELHTAHVQKGAIETSVADYWKVTTDGTSDPFINFASSVTVSQPRTFVIEVELWTDAAEVAAGRNVSMYSYISSPVSETQFRTIPLTTTPTRYQFIVRFTSGTNFTFRLDLEPNSSPAGAYFYYRNWSVRELPGNHRFQTTAASRPILRQSPILGPEFALSGLEGVVVQANNGSVTITAVNSVIQGRQYQVKIPAGLKISGPSTWVATSTGQPMTVTANINGTFAVLNPTASPITLTGVSVREIQGYYTDRNYLEYDGVDDFLQTNSVDFTGTDKVSLFAGVRKLSDAAIGTVLELSASSSANTNTFAMFAPISTSGNFAVRSGGTVNQQVLTPGVYQAPISAVLTAKGDIIADTLSLAVNGVVVASGNADQGAGNYGNYPLYFGRRAGTSLPLNGYEYSIICVGRLTSELETRSIERILARRTGVTVV